MPDEEIAALPVDAWAARRAALYLWTTTAKFESALGVMRAWGFTYRSQFVWTKERMATGFWNRNRHELLLIGARGASICPRYRGITLADSVIDGGQRDHSSKPDEARAIIERYHPSAERLELFARGPARPGWHAWGLEAGQ